MEILLPVIILGSLGILFGIWLSFAEKMFFVKRDPRIERIFSLLPGANCGVCGKAGCFGLAEALSRGEVDIITCPAVSRDSKEQIAETVGIKLQEEVKVVATLICGGGRDCKDKFQYQGPADCNIANLVFGGHKGCVFGCLGFASCEKACPFGAISMGDDNLPRIDPEKCTACRKCIAACPKDVLVLSPPDSLYHIMCNSKDRAQEVSQVCKVGCIGCGKCVKTCPVSAIALKDNLAAIDYARCTNCGECIEVCPTSAIIRRDKGVREYYRIKRN